MGLNGFKSAELASQARQDGSLYGTILRIGFAKPILKIVPYKRIYCETLGGGKQKSLCQLAISL